MKTCVLTMTAAGLAFLCGCSIFKKDPDPNVLTSEEAVRGWFLLWDGESPSNGWVGVASGCSNFTARGWCVTNGALVASAGADAIRTAVPFKDFDLKVDYRLAPDASGRIQYFHNAETNVDTSLSYTLTPLPPAVAEKDPMAWQTARIVARGRSVIHWREGAIFERKTRADAELGGRIVLVPLGGQVEFRNVKLRAFGKW